MGTAVWKCECSNFKVLDGSEKIKCPGPIASSEKGVLIRRIRFFRGYELLYMWLSIGLDHPTIRLVLCS